MDSSEDPPQLVRRRSEAITESAKAKKVMAAAARKAKKDAITKASLHCNEYMILLTGW